MSKMLQVSKIGAFAIALLLNLEFTVNEKFYHVNSLLINYFNIATFPEIKDFEIFRNFTLQSSDKSSTQNNFTV
jgi:hypothetical protein